MDIFDPQGYSCVFHASKCLSASICVCVCVCVQLFVWEPQAGPLSTASASTCSGKQACAQPCRPGSRWGHQNEGKTASQRTQRPRTPTQTRCVQYIQKVGHFSNSLGFMVYNSPPDSDSCVICLQWLLDRQFQTFLEDFSAVTELQFELLSACMYKFCISKTAPH
ncbi:hypothetical protein XENOCAPTIV_029233 [Xenoophorus captivus]|uniref:Uncharacterized protein n=1 Tax=Xenoophorus captivus TaxID=1517983 RepID=A0ABV0SD20_9TELE